MAVTTLLPNTSLIRTKRAATVWTRASWSGAWIERPDLLVQTVTSGVASVGEATMRRHYGRIQVKGALQPTSVAPLDISNHWVKISIATDSVPVLWYGVIVAEQRAHQGAYNGITPSGDQVFTALDPGYLLTRVQVTHSYIWNTAITNWMRIERPLAFNQFVSDRSGRNYVQGNKHAGQVYFTKSFDEATTEPWTALNAALYILSRYFRAAQDPTRSFLNVANGPQFVLDMRVGDFTLGEVRTEGQTVFDVLDQIFNRRRALAWWIEPFGNLPEQGFSIVVDSLAHTTRSANPAAITANKTQVVLDLRGTPDVETVLQVTSQGSRYNRVKVTGGRQGCVFTVSQADGTLQPDWSLTQRSDYIKGVADLAGYSLLDLSTRKTRNDRERSSRRLRHVFTRFRMPKDWDGQAGDGAGGMKRYCFPQLDNMYAGVVAFPGRQIWPESMRLLPYLPLRESVDYSQLSSQPTNQNLSGSLPGLQRPFAALQMTHKSGAKEWFLADAASAVTVRDEMVEHYGGELACSVQMADHQLGLTVSPGGMPHLMQKLFSFAGELPPTIGSSHVEEGLTEYQTMVCTVYAQCDDLISYTTEFLTPQGTVPSQYNLTETLVIRLGDRARFDWILGGTVLDVRNGQLVRTANHKILRDDRSLMAAVATYAREWYHAPRKSIRVQLNDMRPDVRLGQLVVRVMVADPDVLLLGNGQPLLLGNGEPISLGGAGSQVVNSVITAIRYDVEAGATEIATQYVDIDFAEIFA